MKLHYRLSNITIVNFKNMQQGKKEKASRNSTNEQMAKLSVKTFSNKKHSKNTTNFNFTRNVVTIFKKVTLTYNIINHYIFFYRASIFIIITANF